MNLLEMIKHIIEKNIVIPIIPSAFGIICYFTVLFLFSYLCARTINQSGERSLHVRHNQIKCIRVFHADIIFHEWVIIVLRGI